MFGSGEHHLGRKALWLASAFVVLSIFPVLQLGAADSASAHPKLSTPLADVAGSVSQDQGPDSGRRMAPPGFSAESLPKSARDAVRTRMMRINPNGEVQVYILVSALSDENVKQLQAAGVTVELKDVARRIVQAEVPLTRLAQVSALPFVQFIRLPTYARHHTGSVDTEGDAILRADQLRQQYKLDGTGVRVAAISDGLKGVFAAGCTSCQGVAGGPISTADLPSATGTRNSNGVLTASTGGINGQTFDMSSHDLEGTPRDNNGNPITCGFKGAGAEGTALLEIIHDIAPGAVLSFANFSTELEFNNAVNSLAASNDVVVDDIGFFGNPFDGTSSISSNTASALNSTSNPIRAYVTSVGNEADLHYLGTYTDSGTDGFSITTRHGDLHRFQATASTSDTLNLGPQTFNEVELQQNGEVVVFLGWDDTFGSSTNDFDVYLVQHGTNTIVASDVGKTCEGPTFPVACFSFVNTGAQGFFDIIIQNPGNTSATKNLNLFAFTPECALGSLISLGPSHAKINFNTIQNSVIAEGDAGGSPVSVISVGAICSASASAQAALAGSIFPDASCNDTTNSTIQFFSSVGPTLDGRVKPDISAIDGVSITGAGSFENPFFGTSAAAPHVAGIAALLLQAKTCLLNGTTGALDSAMARADLRNNLLLNPSVPLPDLASSPNNTFGFGRADALNSADATLPAFTGATTVVVPGTSPNGASLTASQLGYPNPQTCPLATLDWTGGCGTGPATSMNCPFGPTAVTVSASNNGIDYPATSTALTITVTNFSVAESPSSVTVAAGQSAAYTVTVSPQGGAFANAITLACSNLPAASTCSFNPAQVTPGATSAQSTMTVSTTARSLTPPGNDAPTGRLPRWAPIAHWNPPRILSPLVFWLALTAFALLGLVNFRRSALTSRRRWATWSAASLALAFFSIQLACGGGGTSTPPPQTGTPAGSYNLSVSGTSGTLVQSGTATLVVQ